MAIFHSSGFAEMLKPGLMKDFFNSFLSEEQLHISNALDLVEPGIKKLGGKIVFIPYMNAWKVKVHGQSLMITEDFIQDNSAGKVADYVTKWVHSLRRLPIPDREPLILSDMGEGMLVPSGFIEHFRIGYKPIPKHIQWTSQYLSEDWIPEAPTPPAPKLTKEEKALLFAKLYGMDASKWVGVASIPEPLYPGKIVFVDDPPIPYMTATQIKDAEAKLKQYHIDAQAILKEYHESIAKTTIVQLATKEQAEKLGISITDEAKKNIEVVKGLILDPSQFPIITY